MVDASIPTLAINTADTTKVGQYDLYIEAHYASSPAMVAPAMVFSVLITNVCD